MGADPQPTPSLPPLIGQRYVVRRRIGRGGSASVYAAYDLRLRTWRAVKILHTDLAEDEELRERFLLEAAAMANFDHPNVVRVSDVVHDVDIPYMVMEWLEGGSIATWLRNHGPMPLELARDVMIQVTSALVFVHERNVIHRDVNPRNLLIDRNGVVKLTDFGIARIPSDGTSTLAVDLDRHPTEIGTVMGTEAYMAPEQRRDSATVDGRADLYAAGATLYTLLTGRLPPDLSMVGPADPRIRELPPLVAPLVVRACKYIPDQRHPDAESLRIALTRIRKRLPAASTQAQLKPSEQPLPLYPPLALEPDEVESLTELMASDAVTGLYDGGSEAPARARPVSVGVWAVLGLALLTAAVVVALLGAGGMVAAGNKRVIEARFATIESERRYHALLDRIMDEDIVGAGVPEVEAAYRDFDLASGAPRAAAAERVFDVLVRAGEGSDPKQTSAVENLRHARQDYLDAYTGWRRAAQAPSGRLAIAIGIASAPD